MALVLAVERIVSNNALDTRLFTDHYLDGLVDEFFNSRLDLFDQIRFAGFSCIECKIAAVDVAHHIFKTKSLEGFPKLFHFDHSISADINAAEKGDVPHWFCISITNRYRTSDLIVRS